MSDNAEISVPQLINKFQALCDRVSEEGKPKVKHRKELQSLYLQYTKVIDADETTLSDVSALQSLLSKAQTLIR